MKKTFDPSDMQSRIDSLKKKNKLPDLETFLNAMRKSDKMIPKATKKKSLAKASL